MKVEKFLSMSQCDTPTLQPCENCGNTTVTKDACSPAIGDPARLGITRPPAEFQREVLGRIAKAHPTAEGMKNPRWQRPREV